VFDAVLADPLSPDVQLGLAWLLMSLGRYDEAAARCLEMSAEGLHPLKIQCLGRVQLGQGRIEEAVRFLAEDPDLSGNPQGRGFFGYALARSGRREEAERMAAASDHANEQALIYAGLGDKDRTLEALERMTVVGAQRVGQYLNYPELALLRGDPRLKVFRRKVGLPPLPAITTSFGAIVDAVSPTLHSRTLAATLSPPHCQLEGTAGRVGDAQRPRLLSALPISARHHQPCRLALLPHHPELPRCRRPPRGRFPRTSALPTRCRSPTW
jgi:hypothetical protein